MNDLSYQMLTYIRAALCGSIGVVGAVALVLIAVWLARIERRLGRAK
jgi:ABC-type transporter Mla subunit MlaD